MSEIEVRVLISGHVAPPPMPETLANWSNSQSQRRVINRQLTVSAPTRVNTRDRFMEENVTLEQLRRRLERDKRQLEHIDEEVNVARERLSNLERQRTNGVNMMANTQRLIQAFEDAESVAELKIKVAELERRLAERGQ